MRRRLFLIPNSIAGEHAVCVSTQKDLAHVRLFFVEEPKSARRLIKAIHPEIDLRSCRLIGLNEHTPSTEFGAYISLMESEDAGIISESGCPCVADPGSDLVLLAHRQGIEIIPLVGPSSILLALMASGLNGQNFAFNGYLPREEDARIKKIKELGKRSALEGQTQIVMDTPYRNERLFSDLLKTLEPAVLLCVACDIHGPQQLIRTDTVADWRKSKTSLPTGPALFIINANAPKNRS